MLDDSHPENVVPAQQRPARELSTEITSFQTDAYRCVFFATLVQVLTTD